MAPKLPAQVNHFNHIDLRVADMAAALPFYRKLMPAIGFTAEGVHKEPNGIVWQVFLAENTRPDLFFSITEEPGHRPNRNCIAFFVASREEVDRIASLVREAGGRNLEEPCYCPEYSAGYYATFFEDPAGNRLEVVNWPL